MLSDDLITLGYLEDGSSPTRAIERFQRHAQRNYRKTAAGDAVHEAPVYTGPVDGVAQQATLDEIARWLQLGYRLPLGYFKVAKVAAWGSLREDAAAAWLALMSRVNGLGGTIDGPYGDTRRPLMKTISVGASKFSFRICGRAVDLNQGLGNSRYHVVPEPRGERMWWRIFCKTAHGTSFDLTAEIERGGLFERIPAQPGWEQDGRKREWWHFQWVPEKQKTFQDECELIGITEKQLRAAGYQDADLDHVPG